MTPHRYTKQQNTQNKTLPFFSKQSQNRHNTLHTQQVSSNLQYSFPVHTYPSLERFIRRIMKTCYVHTQTQLPSPYDITKINLSPLVFIKLVAANNSTLRLPCCGAVMLPTVKNDKSGHNKSY